MRPNFIDVDAGTLRRCEWRATVGGRKKRGKKKEIFFK